MVSLLDDFIKEQKEKGYETHFAIDIYDLFKSFIVIIKSHDGYNHSIKLADQALFDEEILKRELVLIADHIDHVEEERKRRDLEKDPLKIFPSRMALDDYIEDLKHVGYEVEFRVTDHFLRVKVCRDNECYVRFCSFEMLTDEYKLMSEIEICANEVSSKLGDLNGED